MGGVGVVLMWAGTYQNMCFISHPRDYRTSTNLAIYSTDLVESSILATTEYFLSK